MLSSGRIDRSPTEAASLSYFLFHRFMQLQFKLVLTIFLNDFDSALQRHPTATCGAFICNLRP